ncbi:unnamed protein product [Camellia sinensis]
MACNGENTTFLPSITYFMLASNGISSTIRAYSQSDYSMVAFIFFIYLSFLLLQYCLSAYQRLPPDQDSLTKDLLKFAVWFLFSAMIFGFAYQFAPLISLVAAISVFAIATAGSALLFYVCIIYGDGKTRGCGEEKRNYSRECACPVDQVSDEKIQQYDFVLEKLF